MKPDNPSPLAQELMTSGRSASCPLIEMHAHYGPYYGAYLPVQPHEKMRHALERAGVVKAVCSAHEAITGDVDFGNAMTQRLVAENGDLFLGYWVVNPREPQSLARAGNDFERTRGFVGFKLGPEYHTYPLEGPRYAEALEYAHSHRLLVLIHTWGGSPYDSPRQVGVVAERYSEATFLMGHSGFGDWETSVAVAHDYPNVFLELTAVYAAHDFSQLPGGSSTPLQLSSCTHVNGIIEYMVQEAGSQKIVFGTDMPWYSPHYAVGAIMFARLDDEARHDICHRNAEGLLERVRLANPGRIP